MTVGRRKDVQRLWADSAEVVGMKEGAIWSTVLWQIKRHIMNTKYLKKIRMQYLRKAQLKHSKTNQLRTDNMPLVRSDMPMTKKNIIQARLCRPHSTWTSLRGKKNQQQQKINKPPHTDVSDGATVLMNMIYAELIRRRGV